MKKRNIVLATALGISMLGTAVMAQSFQYAGDLPTARQMHSAAYNPTAKTVYALGGNIAATNGLDVALTSNDSIGLDYATFTSGINPAAVTVSAQGPIMSDFLVNCGSSDDGVATYNFDGALFYNDRVYMTPGNTNASAPWGVNKILMCSVDGAGVPTGSWSDATAVNVPPAPSGAGFVVFDAGWEIYGGRIYRAAGREAAEACVGGGATRITSVVSAPILGDGTIGTWRAETAFPVANDWGCLLIANDTAVYVGGYDGANRLDTVYVSPVSTIDGTLGAWTAATNYPEQIYMSSGGTNGNDIAIVTGRKNAGAGVTTAYKATVSGGTIGAWSVLATLPVTTGHRYGAGAGANGVWVITGGRDDVDATVDPEVWVFDENNPSGVHEWSLY